ncbi:hypothetical protein, variant [Saprolegnia diclina VS20]|uniref:Uncharacterized protein n=1 Tax=Saprolegnia diclina (strain VS20) TaxID=1156394 RepID=T0R3X2_SAPDV|nr:hypothetical protein, variant [Saprolegnia diclina VS20]EQC26743.1 hypothetical protein, variant [Saprolegnia diclina VS20]|eukprot:XP_008619866.1 hypothetical protein, variant [Saprolegnia diclina VS20]
MTRTMCEVLVPKTIGRRDFDGTDVRAIASEARCKVHVEASHLSPVANTRLLVVAGDPDQVGRALAAAMDHVQRLSAEARRLPCTAAYRYVYGKASLYIPSHFANVLSSRRDLVDALLVDGSGDMLIAPTEEMSIGITKRQVQVVGTEPEVHAIVAKLDASLQRHEAWRLSQQLQGDEVVLKCVLKSSDLATCDQVIEQLGSRFTVSVSTSSGTRDRSVLAISGCKHEVIQATMYVAAKVTSSRPAPSNARRRSRERGPPTERQRARPVPKAFQSEPALAPHVSAESDAPRAPLEVKREATVAAARGTIDLNEIGRVSIPSRDPRLLRQRAPPPARLMAPQHCVPLHATSLLQQEPSSMQLEPAQSLQPPARAASPLPVVVKPEPNTELRPPVDRAPMPPRVTASLVQEHVPSPRHEATSSHVRPEVLVVARPAPPRVPSIMAKPKPNLDPRPSVGQSLQHAVTAPLSQPRQLPSPRPQPPIGPPAIAASPAPSVVIKPEPSVGSPSAALQPHVPARRDAPLASPADRESPTADVVVKPEPLQSLPPTPHQPVAQHRDLPCAPVALIHPVVQAEPVQPATEVYVKPEPRHEPVRAMSNPHSIRPRETRRVHAAIPPMPSSHPVVQTAPVQSATEVYIKPEPRAVPTRATPVAGPDQPGFQPLSSHPVVQAEPVQPATEVYIKPEPRLEPASAASRRPTSASALAHGLSEAPRAGAGKRKADASERTDGKRVRHEMPADSTLCAQPTRVTSRIARSIALRLVQSGLQQVSQVSS